MHATHILICPNGVAHVSTNESRMLKHAHTHTHVRANQKHAINLHRSARALKTCRAVVRTVRVVSLLSSRLN